MVNSGNDIMRNALLSANLNDSYMIDNNPASPSINMVSERLSYLERVVAGMQNDACGYRQTIDEQNKKILQLEKELNIFQQYNRRESIEISGVPENIPQSELERKMIDVLRRSGVHNLCHYEIAACHRLQGKKFGEKTKLVIIRFVNRKRAYEALSNRRNLRHIHDLPGLFVHNSLCFKYSEIYEKCRELRNNNELAKYWIYNGFVHIKRTDSHSEKPKKFYHIDDLDEVPDEWPV